MLGKQMNLLWLVELFNVHAHKSQPITASNRFSLDDDGTSVRAGGFAEFCYLLECLRMTLVISTFSMVTLQGKLQLWLSPKLPS
jgi:hypothetical protein